MTDLHIIKKQLVEVIANGVGDSFVLQKDVEDLCKLKLIPRLGLLLDKYGSASEVIRIDKISIEVENISLSEFEDMLIEKVLQGIEEKLRKKISANSTKINQQSSSTLNRDIELLIFYLRKGYLPWWSTVKNTLEWQKKLDDLLSPGNHGVEWTDLRGAFKEPLVRERLVAELSEKHFWLIVNRISPIDYKTLSADLSLLHQFIKSKRSQNTFKNQILKSIAEDSETHSLSYTLVGHLRMEAEESQLFSASPHLLKKIRNKELQTMLLQLKRNPLSTGRRADNKKSSHTESDTSEESALTSKENTLQEEIYIGDSGLTIVAPYLTLFFKNLQLVDSDQIKDIPKALRLLHYITYGESDYAGFECVLAKILCGVDLSAVMRKSRISEEEKVLADELLQAIIDHWQALKRTSVTGLRTSFLQREGRLSFENNEWKLKVHSESYDLLLSHLPWNINIIKLPWMNHILKVDWI